MTFNNFSGNGTNSVRIAPLASRHSRSERFEPSASGLTFRGRFAPSPSGRMHAGNIYSALLTWLICRASGGSVVLRIEDLDPVRCCPEYAEQVMRDFELLGLTWDEDPLYQHDRAEAYREAFDQLSDRGLVYPCFCSRADLKAASAPHPGERWIYAGTCRNLTHMQQDELRNKLARDGRLGPSWRIALPEDGPIVSIDDLIQGAYEENLSSDVGDFIVRRADGVFAYQLAVVIDDAEQEINLVSRGIDLLSSSPQQRHLQQLLGLPSVDYAHFPLLCAPDGRRLAKRDGDASLEQLLKQQGTAAGVIGYIAHLAGLIDEYEPLMPDNLLPYVTLQDMQKALGGTSSLAW